MAAQRTFEPANGCGRATLSVREAHDLSSARATVMKIAIGAGVDADRAGKLAIAVSEVATNALVHADGAAYVEIVTTVDRVTVEISDHGPGLAPDRIAQPAPAEQDHGRGLWLAQQLCDRVEILPVGKGTRIALSVNR